MLQCLLATEALSGYFRNQHWKREINEDNPLGMGGKMAAAYAGLNDDVSPSTAAACPRHRRRVQGCVFSRIERARDSSDVTFGRP